METIDFSSWGPNLNLEIFQGLKKPFTLILLLFVFGKKEYNNDNFKALFLAISLCLFLYPRVHDLCPI